MVVSNMSVDQSLHYYVNPSPELKKKCSVGAPGKDLGLSTGLDDYII